MQNTKIEMPFSELLPDLIGIIGKKLTAYLTGTTDTRTIDLWIAGARPEGHIEQRIRFAYQVVNILRPYDEPEVVQAWLTAWQRWRTQTFARHKEEGGLGEYESEHMLRLAEIYEASLHLFNGDKTDAREWLLSPARGLNNNRPIDYARIDYGTREVRNLIGRLEHGVFS